LDQQADQDGEFRWYFGKQISEVNGLVPPEDLPKWRVQFARFVQGNC